MLKILTRIKFPALPTLLEFPCRKFFGALFGTIGGVFACAFLGRSLVLGTDIPNGVDALLMILTGGFAAYVASSSYETARGIKHGGRDEESE